ncbi:hypothetical protein [Arthrobacter sp. M4]|uniref:hypothetical protein n=1 Tax=Arthrobacter sp. M4 TaxID=218160 RepID=UPI001CDB5312|nr:hypothetical protein [Arthrobacter sp. M4]
MTLQESLAFVINGWVGVGVGVGEGIAVPALNAQPARQSEIAAAAAAPIIDFMSRSYDHRATNQ